MRIFIVGITLLFVVSSNAAKRGEKDLFENRVSDVVIETPKDVSYQVGLLLRCPVCQGMPIAESPAEMAQSMMTRIRELHKEGKSKDEIIEYFIERYGEWVLLEPKAEGINWLVWIMPPIFLLVGIGALFSYIKSNKPRASRRLDSAISEPDSDDEYLQSVRDDVLS